jgi:hypothetical protein
MSDPRTPSDEGVDLRLPAEDISRAYRASARDEPSPELDDAICAAARRGVHARPRAQERRPLQRWGVPLAVAVTLIVGVSVAFLAVDRRDLPSTAGNISEPSARDSVVLGEKISPPPPQANVEQTPEPSAAVTVRPSRERTTREEMFRRRDVAPSPERAQPATPAPASPPDEAAGTPSGAPTAALQVSPPTAATDAKALRKSAPGTPQGEQDAELLSPEVWLQRIRELRAKGDLTRAEDSFRTFRRRYPDYPLPADIPLPPDPGK